MPQVPVAGGAANFGPGATKAGVFNVDHGIFGQWLLEARPTALGVKFGVAGEQLRTTRPAGVGPRCLIIGVFTRKSRFGPPFSQDVVFLGCQPLAPLIIGHIRGIALICVLRTVIFRS